METFKSYLRQKQPAFNLHSKHLSQGERPMVSFFEQLPTLKQTEKLLISEAMKRARHNQAVAAQLLGITRQALNKRLKQGGQ
jgi:DNA-binding protein Fis